MSEKKIRLEEKWIKTSKHLGLASTNKLCDGVWVGEFWGKWRDKHDFEPVSSVTVVHTTYEIIILFFCKYNICKHDEQNVFNMKFILVCLNCKISSKQLSITDLFEEKSDLDARINATFYLSFVGLRVKFKFSFVCCFLVFDTFQCFPSTIIFLNLCSLSTVPWKMMVWGFTVFINHPCIITKISLYIITFMFFTRSQIWTSVTIIDLTPEIHKHNPNICTCSQNRVL